MITVNKDFSYYIVYASVVYFILPLIQYASPQIVIMDFLNYSTSKFVKYFELSNSPYLSTITLFMGFVSSLVLLG